MIATYVNQKIRKINEMYKSLEIHKLPQLYTQMYITKQKQTHRYRELVVTSGVREVGGAK